MAQHNPELMSVTEEISARCLDEDRPLDLPPIPKHRQALTPGTVTGIARQHIAQTGHLVTVTRTKNTTYGPTGKMRGEN